MRRLLIGFIFVLASGLAGANEKFPSVDEAVKAIAGKDLEPRRYSASAPTKQGSTTLGIVFSEAAEDAYGQLFILDRDTAGNYKIVATSKKFLQSQGPHHYVEIVQATGRDRFYIQVNHHEACGIARNIYRFALIQGQWRVSGLDASAPDTLTCDVNNDASEYSANFITGRVIIKEYKSGKVVRTKTKNEKFPVYLLSDFDPEAFRDSARN